MSNLDRDNQFKLLGPPIDAVTAHDPTRSMWSIVSETLRGKPVHDTQTPVTQENFAIRLLLQSHAPQDLAPELAFAHPQLRKQTLQFRRPVAMAVLVAQSGEAAFSSKIAFRYGDGKQAGYETSPAVDAPHFADLVTQPVGKWIAGTKEQEDDKSVRRPRFEIQSMRLQSGVLPLRIHVPDADDDNPLGIAVEPDKKAWRMFGGIRMAEIREKKEGPRIDLVAAGFEFDAKAPAALLRLAGQTVGEQPPIVRLQAGIRNIRDQPTPYLALVGGEQGFLDAVERGIQMRVGQVRAASMLHVDFDRRPQVPLLAWKLERHGKTLRASPDRMELDPRCLRARLVTHQPVGGGTDSVALVPVEAAQITATNDGFQLELASPGTAVGRALHIVSARVQQGPLVHAAVLPAQLPVIFGRDDLAARLTDRYLAERVLPPQDRLAPYAFAPVQAGWCQLPLLDCMAPRPPIAVQEQVSVMAGVLTLRLKDFERVTVEVHGAAHVRLAATMPDVALSTVTTEIYQSSGSLRELFYVADSSPSPEECLPSLAAGPIATSEQVLGFGAAATADSCGVVDSSHGALKLRLFWNPRGMVDSDGREQFAVAWRGHPELPFITSGPLTRTVASGEPLRSRALVPHEYAIATGIVLSYSAQRSLPVLELDGPARATSFTVPWLGKDGRAGLSWMLPSLPGIEIVPGDDRPPLDAAAAAMQVRLRHDLPQLDEYFSSIEVPRGGTVLFGAKEPQNVNRPTIGVTSLDPKRIGAVWQQLADRIATTRTQSAVAIDWHPVGGPTPAALQGLLEPWTWTTAFTFHARVPGGSLPIGAYTLVSALAPDEPYLGSSALSGLNKSFDIEGGKLGEGDAVQVVGNAAAVFRHSASLLSSDTRGLALGSAADAAQDGAPILARQTSFQLSVGECIERTLVTLVSTSTVRIMDCDLQFWCRDLALAHQGALWIFDGEASRPEFSNGPDPHALDREALQASLHEWRLFVPGTGRYDFPLGPFDLRPLRLIRAVFDDAGGRPHSPQEIEVICSASLRTSRSPKQEVFDSLASEEGCNLVVLTLRFDAKPGAVRLQRIQITESAGRFTVSRLDGLKPTDAPLDFSFDVEARPCHEAREGWSGGGRQPIRLLLRLLPTPRGSEVPLHFSTADLELTLFGSPVTLQGGTVKLGQEAPSSLSVEFSEPNKPGTSADENPIRVSRVYLEPHDGDPARLTIELAMGIRAGADAPVVVWNSGDEDGALQWMALASVPQIASIDHARGALTLEVRADAPLKRDALFPGFVVTEYATSIRVMLAVGVASQSGGWPRLSVTSAFLEMKTHRSGVCAAHHLITCAQVDSTGIRAPWSSRLALDFPRRTRDSRVRWPVNAVTMPDLMVPSGKSIVFDCVGDGDPLRHEVDFEALQVICPLDSFDAKNSFRLMRSIPLRIRASHRLRWTGGETNWSTIEFAELADFGAMRDHANEETGIASRSLIFAFAPRYRHNHYRGVEHADRLAHPGIATRAMAAAGLPDLDAARLLSGMTAIASRLVFFGGSLTMFEGSSESPGETAPPCLRWTLPWIATLEEIENLPGDAEVDEPAEKRRADQDPSGFETSCFRNITQQPRAGTARYRVADFDFAASFVSSGDYGQPLALDASGSQEDIVRKLKVLRNAHVARGEQVSADMHVTAAEQPLIELLDKGLSIPFGASTWPAAPVFLRSLLAIKRLRTMLAADSTSGMRSLRVSCLVPIGTDSDHSSSCFMRVSVAGSTAEVTRENAPAPSRLIVLSHEGLQSKDIAADVGTGAVGIARIRAEAVALMRDPVCIALRQQTSPTQRNLPASDNPVQYTNVPASAVKADFPLFRRSIAPRWDTLFASGALGWPEDTDLVASDIAVMRLASIAPQIDDEAGRARDEPFQNAAAGISGRAASITGVAGSGAAFSDGKMGSWRRAILWTHRQVVFEHSAAGEASGGPPARHLNPGRTRLRAPTSGQLKETLLKVGGRASTAGFQSILPGQYERAVIGARPGAMYVEVDTALLTTGNRPMDAGQPRFGQPATAASLLTRQQRHPRSPPLPREDPREFTRRTFISWSEHLPGAEQQQGDQWIPMRACMGPCTLFRAGDAEAGILVRVVGSFCDIRGMQGRPDTKASPAYSAAEIHEIFLEISAPAAWIAEKKIKKTDGTEESVAEVMRNVLRKVGLLRPGVTAANLAAGDILVHFGQVDHWPAAGDAPAYYLRLHDVRSPPQDKGPQYLLNLLVSKVTGDQPLKLGLALGTESWSDSIPEATSPMPLGSTSESSAALIVQPARSLSIILPVRPADRLTLSDFDDVLCAFGDPAFDRMLWSRAQRESRPLKLGGSAALENDWLIATDRAEYNPASSLYMACGPIGASGAWESGSSVFEYDLTIEVTRKNDRGALQVFTLIMDQAPSHVFSPRSPTLGVSRMANKGLVSAAHAIALDNLHLVEAGAGDAAGKLVVHPERFELKAGDRLSASAWIAGEKEDFSLSVEVAVVLDPVLSTPPGVYSVIAGRKVANESFESLYTALHASSPTPQTVEFPDLLGDLARGLVRRRGLFLWRYTNTRSDDHTALIKIDRSGGGQMIDTIGDFVPIY